MVGFQLAGTIAIYKAIAIYFPQYKVRSVSDMNTGPFKIRSSKRPDLKYFWILNAQISVETSPVAKRYSFRTRLKNRAKNSSFQILGGLVQ